MSAEQGTGAKGVSQTRSKPVLMPAMAIDLTVALGSGPPKTDLPTLFNTLALEEKWTHSIYTGRKRGACKTIFQAFRDELEDF